MTVEYPWYSIVEGEELEQGNFINDCDIMLPQYTVIPPAETDQPEFKASVTIEKYDVVIVSQSCDLENGKLDYVLLCPRWSYKEYGDFNREFRKIDKLEQIRQGRHHRYCMLNECNITDMSHETQIVDLGMVFSIPYDIMKQMAKTKGKRLRLLSPYKEKLAQVFAYYYMRVALPNDIARFEKPKASTLDNAKSLPATI